MNKLYRCSAAISGACPHLKRCKAHGQPHEYDERFCGTELCNTFKLQRSDGRWIRQRVQCEEVRQNVHSTRLRR